LLQADDVTFRHGLPTRLRKARGGAVLDERDALPGVHQVSASFGRGRVVGIIGPNGSGKTTLLRLLSGTLEPQGGCVTLGGIDVRRIPRHLLARRIAVVPQETHLAFDYTVLEVTMMGRYPHLGTFALEGPRDLAIARDALEATGTRWLEGRAFTTLSGGEKQRVVIASALAQAAEIILLDEPTASLDLGYQIEVATLLSRLNHERGLTLVVATHDLNFAAAICDELILLRDGRVLAQGPTRQALTTESIRALYGVEADVHEHPLAGHLTVVPLRKADRADTALRSHDGGR
jgi:iron complex transport system ATP-binding protein